MMLLGQDELTDVFALLDRITLDALLVVSRKFCNVVQCSRLRIARRAMSWIWIAVASHRGKICRFLDRFRKKPRPWPHKVVAHTGFEHWADLRMHFENDSKHSEMSHKVVLPTPEACYRFLSHVLPVSRIEELYMTFRPTSSAITEAFQSPDNRHGCIDELVFSCDANDVFRLEPNVFENLPLLSGSIHQLELRGGVSPQQQSDRFVRNCMRRCVRKLKATRKNWHPEKIPSGVCDVGEDTILEFCFRSDLQEHREECQWTREDRGQGPEVQLWLNFVTLSDDFLRRFVRASEDCPSDHKVWLFLCGENLNRLDISGSVQSYDGWGYAKHCIFRGKTNIEVGIHLNLRFMVVLRRSLEETPPSSRLIDEDFKFMEFLESTDGLADRSPSPTPPLGRRIASVTINPILSCIYEWCWF